MNAQKKEPIQVFANRIISLGESGMEKTINKSDQEQLIVIAALKNEFKNQAVQKIAELEGISLTPAALFVLNEAIQNLAKRITISPTGQISFTGRPSLAIV